MGPFLISFGPPELPERPRELEFVGRGSMPIQDVRAMLSGRERLQEIANEGLVARGMAPRSSSLSSIPSLSSRHPGAASHRRQWMEHARAGPGRTLRGR